MPRVTIPGPRGPLPGYAEQPSGPGPWPGVVVLHDAGGMTSAITTQVEWLAGAGFLTVAPDLFSYGSTMRCLVSVMRETMRGSGRCFDDIDAARAWLADHDGCTGRVGVLGFCMGGGFALMLAPHGRYDAASVNYGPLPKDAEQVLRTSCPIVGSFGAKDPTLRGTAARLDRILTEAGVPHDVMEYPDAGHSFMEEIAWREIPLPLAVAGKLSGSRFHGPSMRDARARIEAFLATHLAEPD